MVKISSLMEIRDWISRNSLIASKSQELHQWCFGSFLMIQMFRPVQGIPRAWIPRSTNVTCDVLINYECGRYVLLMVHRTTLVKFWVSRVYRVIQKFVGVGVKIYERNQWYLDWLWMRYVPLILHRAATLIKLRLPRMIQAIEELTGVRSPNVRC